MMRNNSILPPFLVPVFGIILPALLLLHLLPSVSTGGPHPPPPHPPELENSEISLPVECFGRCVAKCLSQLHTTARRKREEQEEDQKNMRMNKCQTECRPYGQHTLCESQSESFSSSSSSELHDRPHFLAHPPSNKNKNMECWKRCKDLTAGNEEPPHPPKPPAPPPRDVVANINANFTIDIRWARGPEPDPMPVPLFLIRIDADTPNHQTSQIFTEGFSLNNLNPPSPESICGPMTIQVASVSAETGVGHFSKPMQLDAKSPLVAAKMELFTAKFNTSTFVTDEYQVNGTVDVELAFQFEGWPFGIEDLEVSPLFHLLACSVPDLSQAMPVPEFHVGTQLNTVITHLGADMMYRRCRFVYAVEEVRSARCDRQYGIVAGQKDFQSIEFNCDTVEDSALAPGDECLRKAVSRAPMCGQFDQFNYTIIDEPKDNDALEENEEEKTVSVNITFQPFQRVVQLKPQYYVALYGNAEKYANDDQRLLAGVNMTDVLGNMTNCAKFVPGSKTCKRFYSNNSIVLDGLRRTTSYGVMLCAVLDPNNLTFPSVDAPNKSLKPRAFGMFLPASRPSHHDTDSGEVGGGGGGDGPVMESHKDGFNIVVLLVIIILLVIGLLAAAIISFICWMRRQKEHLRKKRLNFEAMRRQGREQRYTDFPARSREDPWELERRNLIIYEDQKLGSGAFGTVFLGKLVGINRLKKENSNLSIGLLRAENAMVAVKMLPEYADDISKSEFLREIGLMKTLGYHERLVNMLACVTQSEPYCLIVEYCSDGDLLQFLRVRCKYMLELDDAGVHYSDPACDGDFDRAMIMTVKQLLMFAVQISYGLEYLSQKGFVHRDVAARNILVHEKRHAKIGDFGLCRFIYADSANYMGRGGRLPIKWMSPEAIRHYEFTTSSDVWSFGILMFEIITLGGTPYPGIQPDDMLAFLESGQRIQQPDNCPNDFYKVMHSCWCADARMRPDFAAVRQQLALQLENVSDEYSYLKLDAKKDYYNVSYGELKAQRGEHSNSQPPKMTMMVEEDVEEEKKVQQQLWEAEEENMEDANGIVAADAIGKLNDANDSNEGKEAEIGRNSPRERRRKAANDAAAVAVGSNEAAMIAMDGCTPRIVA